MAEYTSPFVCEVEGCDEFVIHAHAKRCWDHELLRAASRVMAVNKTIENTMLTREVLTWS